MITNLLAPNFKPDIIVSYPRNCDYPVWRYFIRTTRHLYNNIIISLTDPQGGFDYSPFVKQVMFQDDIKFYDAPPPLGEQDWRNMAVNDALQHSDNDWVWFTEQDFIVTGEEFWQTVYKKIAAGFDLIGIAEGGRLHPACIFVKREVIEKTRRNFGIVKDKGDHFCMFQEDIERLNITRTYLADEDKYQYKHLNGFSHNFRLISEGQPPVYKPDEFFKYIGFSLDIENQVLLHPEFKRVAQKALAEYNLSLLN